MGNCCSRVKGEGTLREGFGGNPRADHYPSGGPRTLSLPAPVFKTVSQISLRRAVCSGPGRPAAALEGGVNYGSESIRDSWLQRETPSQKKTESKESIAKNMSRYLSQ